jgi:hypothetical protein
VSLNSDEAAFVAGVSRQTGIDPRVLVAWVQAEGAYAPNGTGGHNYLNLRPAAGDVGTVAASSGNFDQFATVQDAITSTVNRLHNPFASGIIAAARKTPRQEIGAIAASAWDSGHYGGNGGQHLLDTFSSIFTAAGLDSSYQGPDTAQAVAATAGTGSAGPSDTSVSGTLNSATGGLSGGVTSAAGGIIDAIDSVPKFLAFVTSWRFVEVVGGFFLLLVGLYLIGRQLGAAPSVPQAVETVAGKVPAVAAAREGRAMSKAFSGGETAGRRAGARREGVKAGQRTVASRETIDTRPRPVYSTRAKAGSASRRSSSSSSQGATTSTGDDIPF